MQQECTIGSKVVGSGKPAYIIAEMSGNHNQSYDKAVEIIHAMHDAGSDAVKLQTYTADTITFKSDREDFQIKGDTLWDGKTLHELYEEAATPWEWHSKLQAEANSLGMDFFSTPFDPTAADFLEDLDVPAYKIASFELVDIPLIRHVATKGKPVILSTGMGSAEEIADAVAAVQEAGNTQLILLKCTSAYPAPLDAANLRTMQDMHMRFGVPIGISDHTMGTDVPVTAVLAGACIIEKHFCLSREDEGIDSAFSLEPHEFKAMIEAVRHVESAPSTLEPDLTIMGEVSYDHTEKELANVPFRRSLFVVKDIEEGETFTTNNVRSIRPGTGLSPKQLDYVLGKQSAKHIAAGTPLHTDHIA